MLVEISINIVKKKFGKRYCFLNLISFLFSFSQEGERAEGDWRGGQSADFKGWKKSGEAAPEGEQKESKNDNSGKHPETKDDRYSEDTNRDWREGKSGEGNYYQRGEASRYDNKDWNQINEKGLDNRGRHNDGYREYRDLRSRNDQSADRREWQNDSYRGDRGHDDRQYDNRQYDSKGQNYHQGQSWHKSGEQRREDNSMRDRVREGFSRDDEHRRDGFDRKRNSTEYPTSGSDKKMKFVPSSS